VPGGIRIAGIGVDRVVPGRDDDYDARRSGLPEGVEFRLGGLVVAEAPVDDLRLVGDRVVDACDLARARAETVGRDELERHQLDVPGYPGDAGGVVGGGPDDPRDHRPVEEIVVRVPVPGLGLGERGVDPVHIPDVAAGPRAWVRPDVRRKVLVRDADPRVYDGDDYAGGALLERPARLGLDVRARRPSVLAGVVQAPLLREIGVVGDDRCPDDPVGLHEVVEARGHQPRDLSPDRRPPVEPERLEVRQALELALEPGPGPALERPQGGPVDPVLGLSQNPPVAELLGDLQRRETARRGACGRLRLAGDLGAQPGGENQRDGCGASEVSWFHVSGAAVPEEWPFSMRLAGQSPGIWDRFHSCGGGTHSRDIAFDYVAGAPSVWRTCPPERSQTKGFPRGFGPSLARAAFAVNRLRGVRQRPAATPAAR